MESNLIDAHVHLSDDVFSKDIESVLIGASQKGVKTVFNVTTTREELDRSIDYAKRFPCVHFYHIAGTPPQDVSNGDLQNDKNYFQQKALEGVLSAIGEVGLDYGYASDEELVLQKQVFIEYIHMALSFNLPLVIHCRNAFDDFFDILDAEYSSVKGALPGMLHCFTGSIEEARKLVDRGWFVSLSGILTFKTGENLRAVASYLPWENILVESDAPYLAPVPVRGKRNEPGNVIFTTRVLADLKKTSFEETVQIVSGNSNRFLSR